MTACFFLGIGDKTRLTRTHVNIQSVGSHQLIPIISIQ